MIKNLLIDLGGVIMDIRRTDCVDAFKALGFDTIDDYLTDYAQKGPFEALEEGRISPTEFRDSLRPMMPGNVTDSQIDAAFMKFLVSIPEERLRALSRLRSRGLRLYVLSNTNPIMWHGKILNDFRKDGFDIDHYFDGALTSFDAKVQKPAPEIFLIAAERFGLNPGETLFIDDSQRNLDTAAALGFQTLLAAPGTEFGPLVENHLQQ